MIKYETLNLIHPHKTPGGHRRYSVEEIKNFKNGSPDNILLDEVTLAYCRVSSRDQADNLERQVGRVLQHCATQNWKVELYKVLDLVSTTVVLNSISS